MTDFCDREIVVLGCGNVLFGDDGFGPEVVVYLQKNYEIPPNACILNAGLRVRDFLFTIVLSKKRPKKIIIVDAVDAGKVPGETFELDISDIPEKKIADFSMHQLPTSNLLRELKDMCGVKITIISAQVQYIPEGVSPGLSKVMREAVPVACEKIFSALK
ncbi:MAG: hydrogenase maturation protease [bacterium]